MDDSKMTDSEKMLDIRHISFQYDEDDYVLFDDISFTVGRGEFVSLIGPSGSGKSTIFKLINHFLPLRSGEILVDGKDISKERVECGYMPQHDLLFPWRTVEQNVMLPMEIQGVPKDKRKEVSDELLDRVGLSGTQKKYPRELSGGMRQRAAFARTLATGAQLLLLDEPFSALDSITRISMQEWILQQWDTLHKTILFVTHDVEEAIFLSQKILVLSGKPIHNVTQVDVPLPKERSREMLLDPDILRLKEHLVDQLRQEAGE